MVFKNGLFLVIVQKIIIFKNHKILTLLIQKISIFKNDNKLELENFINYLMKLLDKQCFMCYNKFKINRKEGLKMKEIKMNVFEMEGYAITVDIEGDIREYAESFLHIFNNVREGKELLKVKNYYDSNEVTVYCELDSKDALIKYLKAFGEVKACDRVLLYQLTEPEYDLDKYYDAVVVTEFN